MRWRRVLLGGEGAIGGGLEVADAWPVGIGEVDWARGMRWNEGTGLGLLDSLMLADKDTSNR
uniref:Uncharacterized protein n=1 Tax=Oryza glumipatula TaxID=40148 RepID=A0A0D9ZJT2_9ORYZ